MINHQLKYQNTSVVPVLPYCLRHSGSIIFCSSLPLGAPGSLKILYLQSEPCEFSRPSFLPLLYINLGACPQPPQSPPNFPQFSPHYESLCPHLAWLWESAIWTRTWITPMSGNLTPSFKSLTKLTQLSCGKSCGKPRPMDVNSWDLLSQDHLWFWIIPHPPPTPSRLAFDLLLSCSSLSLLFISPQLFSQDLFVWADTVHDLKWKGSYKIKKETTSSWMSAVSDIIFLPPFLQALLVHPPLTDLLWILYSRLCFTSKFQFISNENQSLHHHSPEFLQHPGCWLGMEKTCLTLDRPFAALGFIYLPFEFSTPSVTNFLLLKHPTLHQPILLAGALPYYSVENVSHVQFPPFSPSYKRMSQMVIFLYWSLSFLTEKQEFSLLFFC